MIKFICRVDLRSDNHFAYQKDREFQSICFVSNIYRFGSYFLKNKNVCGFVSYFLTVGVGTHTVSHNTVSQMEYT